VAPTALKDRVIVGVSGDDFDMPGYIQSHNPESGAMQWRWYTVPMNPGDPGMESWPNEEMARRRHDVAADHLRSGAQPHLRHDG
jgi:hypothetical protein